MSTSTDKQDAQGRSWDQITKNGTSSAGSMGVGATGDSGKLSQGQSEQSASRTDDLLTDGNDEDAGGSGFASSGGQVQTGLEGMGNKSGGAAGNRQSAPQSGEGGRRSTDAADAGNAGQGDRQNR